MPRLYLVRVAARLMKTSIIATVLIVVLLLFPRLADAAGRRVPWTAIKRTPRWLNALLLIVVFVAVCLWMINLGDGEPVAEIN